MKIEIKEDLNIGWLIGIKKYEKSFDGSGPMGATCGFPTAIISITDEDNLLSRPKALLEIEDGRELYITLKNDGSSVTYIVENGVFKAHSRKFEVTGGFPVQAAIKYGLMEKMLGVGYNIAVQGEAIGPKLNGNRMKLTDIELRLFRAKNIDTRDLFNYSELKSLAFKLGVPMVEELSIIKFDKNIHTVEFFRAMADSVKWPNTGEPAEGIVIAPVIPFWSNILKKSWSVKIINQTYKQE